MSLCPNSFHLISLIHGSAPPRKGSPRICLTESHCRTRGNTSRFDPFTAGLASNADAYCNIALGNYVVAEQSLARARQACEPINALYVLSYAACFSAGIEMITGDVAAATPHWTAQ
jgi:hypothetical protein